MATQREIKKRIASVASTRKITKTMEMVSTSKMKKMQDRLLKTQPYLRKIENIILNIRESAVEELSGTLFDERAKPQRILLFLIAGNRGLCGGYNANVIDFALRFKRRLELEEGKEVLLYVMGKKAINYCKFSKIATFKTIINPEDKISFEESAQMGEELINLFQSGEIDEAHFAYTKIITSATQKPAIERVLPVRIEIPGSEFELRKSEFKADYIFEPTPYEVLNMLLPLYVKVKLFTCILESGFSEQFARRVAMKNATDAATDMVRELTIRYNRARQAKITKEIAEIVGGASALE
ncbi:MAG: ATP synthase F1 subunit gamma [Spirochaetes bacterium]|nr:ATP synthase F1 subunit gamma [Spirochaetota bacterium]